MQRKKFRVEEILARNGASTWSETGSHAHDLSSLSEKLSRQQRELSTLFVEGGNRRMTRAAGELGAVTEAMERSTHIILKSAEAIGGCADSIAAQPMDSAKSVARDIHNQLVQIFEACNFQDLAGQRIGKVIEMLCRIDGEISRMLPTNGSDRRHFRTERFVTTDNLLNGPRLDGEAGHVSQGDIDALFD